MRVVVCTDLEGIGGVDRYEACFPAWPAGYRRAQELMEGEVSAVLEGLREAGVEDVLVTDWHFAGNNLRRPEVDAPVEGLWLSGRPTMSASRTYGPRDLAVFVGMHAGAGRPDAFMSHTFWQGLAIEVDGVPVDEAYLWATMVGATGARLGFVAGERELGDEVTELLPGVPFHAVKDSHSRTRARTARDPRDIREELRQAAADAVREHEQRPHVTAAVGTPVRVTFYEDGDAERAARRGLGEPDGDRRIATTLEERDGLIPLLADCLLTTFLGRESQLFARLSPPPERSALPDPLRRVLVTCAHGATAPLMRRGVREWMAEDATRYPAPPTGS